MQFMWSACVALLLLPLLLLRLPLESFLDVLQYETEKERKNKKKQAHTFRNSDTDTIKVVSAWACVGMRRSLICNPPAARTCLASRMPLQLIQFDSMRLRSFWPIFCRSACCAFNADQRCVYVIFEL